MSKQLGREIYVNDRVVVRDKFIPLYRRLYPNADLDRPFTVTGKNSGSGRVGLIVDREPGGFWVGHCKLAWKSVDCKERIEALGL